MEDFTSVLREADALMERLDRVFKRRNESPAYTTEKAMEDAVSDNVRYFGPDRKEEIAEIFFSILSRMTDRIVHQDRTDSFCNPQIPPADGAENPMRSAEVSASAPRLPQMDMLMRSLMPLSWALAGEWEIPELKNTIDEYLSSYTEEEALLVYEVLDFLFRTFPEFSGTVRQVEFMDYWKRMAHDRASLRPEDDQAKSILLDYLLKKRLAMVRKK